MASAGTPAPTARSTTAAIWSTTPSTVIFRLRPLWVALTLSTTSSSSAPTSRAASAPAGSGPAPGTGRPGHG